jgi:hypothetical protein
MIRLRDFMEKLNLPIVSIQTDAIFIDCGNLENVDKALLEFEKF